MGQLDHHRRLHHVAGVGVRADRGAEHDQQWSETLSARGDDVLRGLCHHVGVRLGGLEQCASISSSWARTEDSNTSSRVCSASTLPPSVSG